MYCIRVKHLPYEDSESGTLPLRWSAASDLAYGYHCKAVRWSESAIPVVTQSLQLTTINSLLVSQTTSQDAPVLECQRSHF